MKAFNSIFLTLILPLCFGLSQCKRKSPPSRIALDPTEQIIPTIPAKLRIAVSSQTIELKWQKTPSATSYNIYWSTKKNVTKKNATVIERHPDTKLVHRFLKNNETYYYRISAIGAGGESPLSPEVSGKPVLGDQSFDANAALKSRNPVINANGDAVVFVVKCKDANCLMHTRKKSNEWDKPKVISELGFTATEEGPFPAISADGNSVVFQQKRGIILRKLVSEKWEETVISDNSQGLQTSINADASRVAWLESGSLYTSDFTTTWSAPNLISTAKNFHMSGNGEYITLEDSGIKVAHFDNNTWTVTAVAAGESPQISYDGTLISGFDTSTIKLHKNTAGTWNTSTVSFPECCVRNVPISGDGLTVVQGPYFSEFKNSSWTAVTQYTEGAFNPSIDHDGSNLAFGYDDDIFVVQKKPDNTWAAPTKID